MTSSRSSKKIAHGSRSRNSASQSAGGAPWHNADLDLSFRFVESRKTERGATQPAERPEIEANEVLFEGEVCRFRSLAADGSFELKKAW